MTNSSPSAADHADTAPFLVLRDLSKSYVGVRALRSFSMTVARGEVIGIVGENGAGKSTLMKLLGGVIAPDSGTITTDGTDHPALSVSQSIAAGIAFVHQELNLFENLDVAGNVYIGREPRKGGLLQLVDRQRQRAMTAPLLKRVGANFAPDAPVATLSLAQRQLVEIAKALSVDARLVILDEPTSSLPVAETEKLLEVIAGLKAHGIAVIFISHRLHEIERSADRVIALRDGSLAGTLTRGEITHDRMVKLMIGRDLLVQASEPVIPGPAVLRLKAVQTAAYPRQPVYLDLCAGEILGLAGLVGAGRTELARVIFGVDPMLGGQIELNGEALKIRSTADAVARGIFLAPEDRKATGILLDMPIQQNISLPNLAAHSRKFLVSRGLEAKTAGIQREKLNIKASNMMTLTGLLSGGNQQKVVLAKWLAMTPKVMILDEPTRGIDIGAKSEIYRLMRGLAKSGVAVLMISSDMEEVIGVSDRIAVMHQGAISGFLTRDQFSEENVLLLAIGKTLQQTGTAMNKKDLFLLILILAVGAVVAILNPRFLLPVNIANTSNLVGLFGLSAIGQAFVIITGGIELSVGSVIALVGVLFVDLIANEGVPWPLAMVLMIVLGVLIGLAHGLLVTKLKLQPFIVTLCGLLVYRGVARFYTQDATVGFGFGQNFPALNWLTVGQTFGVPHSFIAMMIVAIIMWVVLHRTVFGRHLYAVGKNEEAARFSGIRTDRVVIFAYVICQVLTVAAAVYFAMYTGSISPETQGNFYELYAIAAAVLGGFSLRGGEGSIIGVVLGVVLLQELQNLVNLLGIPSSLNFAVMGGVILIGVTVDQQLGRFRLRRRETDTAGAVAP